MFPPSFNPCDCPRSELDPSHHHHHHHHHHKVNNDVNDHEHILHNGVIMRSVKISDYNDHDAQSHHRHARIDDGHHHQGLVGGPHPHDNDIINNSSSLNLRKNPNMLLGTMMDYVKSTRQAMKTYMIFNGESRENDNNLNNNHDAKTHVMSNHKYDGHNKGIMCEDHVNINPHTVHAFFFDST